MLYVNADLDYWHKRICFQCNMPYECASGYCAGDICVKTITGDRYVSKGCENRTSKVQPRSITEHLEDSAVSNYVGCIETNLFAHNRID
uniref:Uncharacterized protein n=1 Tax=Acrobeloides nanus TaxID=290746 RepID=A0A914DGE8_9BILA